jgi:heme-degrading monooxygenase HmoA
MSVIEIVRLRPASGVTEEEFLAASDRFEQDYMKKRHGFVRRTLVRGEGDEWAVLVDWETAEDAQASMDAFPSDPASAPFNAVLDPATFEMKRFAVFKVFAP